MEERTPGSSDSSHGHLVMLAELSAGSKDDVAVDYVEEALSENWVTDNPKVEVTRWPRQSSVPARIIWPHNGYARIEAPQKSRGRLHYNIFKNSIHLRYRGATPGEALSFRLGFKPRKILVSSNSPQGPWEDITAQFPEILWGDYAFQVRVPDPVFR